jgi:hypothetical protein
VVPSLIKRSERKNLKNPSRPTYAEKAPMLRPAQPDKTKQEEEDMPTFGNMALANDD